MVERSTDKTEVEGSIPSAPTSKFRIGFGRRVRQRPLVRFQVRAPKYSANLVRGAARQRPGGVPARRQAEIPSAPTKKYKNYFALIIS